MEPLDYYAAVIFWRTKVIQQQYASIWIEWLEASLSAYWQHASKLDKRNRTYEPCT